MLLRGGLFKPTSCLPVDLVREDNAQANDIRVTRRCSLHQIWVIVFDSLINTYSLLHHRHSTHPLQQPRTPHKPPFDHGLTIVPSIRHATRKARVCHISDREIHLTNSPIHAIRAWPLRLVLMLLPQSLISMLLLDAGASARLERCKVDRIRLHQHLGNATDVSDESIDHIEGQTLSDDYSEDLGFLFAGREGVVCVWG